MFESNNIKVLQPNLDHFYIDSSFSFDGNISLLKDEFLLDTDQVVAAELTDSFGSYLYEDDSEGLYDISLSEYIDLLNKQLLLLKNNERV